MCGDGTHPLRPFVNDFTNWKELQSVFKVFQSRCVVSGIAGNKVMLSPDRKIDLTGRYNWKDTIPMMWNHNTAKASCRYIFENLQRWYEESKELQNRQDKISDLLKLAEMRSAKQTRKQLISL